MNKKILICSKDEGMRESFRFMLEDLYELIITDDVPSFLQSLDPAIEIHLSFLDSDIGPEIIDKIKDARPNLQIIAIGGYKSSERAVEMVRQGASGYIIKPFKSDEVLALVKKHVG